MRKLAFVSIFVAFLYAEAFAADPSKALLVSPCKSVLVTETQAAKIFFDNPTQHYLVFHPSQRLPDSVYSEIKKVLNAPSIKSSKYFYFYFSRRKSAAQGEHQSLSENTRNAIYGYIGYRTQLLNQAISTSEKETSDVVELVPDVVVLSLTQANTTPLILKEVLHQDIRYISTTESLFGNGTWISTNQDVTVVDSRYGVIRFDALDSTDWLEVPTGDVLLFSGNDRARSYDGVHSLVHTQPLIADDRAVLTMFFTRKLRSGEYSEPLR